jgi:putative heme iron utilization protein
MSMSKKTVSQMEATLLDRIEQAKNKLGQLQQKHKLEIGSLAYKHGLQHFDLSQLDHAFSKMVR